MTGSEQLQQLPARLDPLLESVIAQLRATREAEREIFGSLDPVARDRPIRPGDWSPKDHQAHLTLWKGRQADRYEAIRHGRAPLVDPREDDEINAELHATRADWAWDDLVAEADAVSQRLESEVASVDPAVLRSEDRLLAGTFGNGPFHAMTHFGWLIDAEIGLDAAQVDRFIDREEELLRSSPLPESDKAVGLYNIACRHVLSGRLDRARPLLRESFAQRPDLRDWAAQDSDLEAIRDELPSLS
jgi:hypothetical protein